MPNAKELSNRILAGGWDGALKKLYGASYICLLYTSRCV